MFLQVRFALRLHFLPRDAIRMEVLVQIEDNW